MASTSTLAELAPAVLDRLQDPNGIFWNTQFEIDAGLEEAINEMLLIVGRPTQIFNAPIQLLPNKCFQPMPEGLLCITNIRTNVSTLGKTTLRALDYLCSNWTASWQSDRDPIPRRWAPLGLSMFIVHPAPLQPITVNVTGIAYPFTGTWPPNGSETSVFRKEFDQALQMYAAAYARLKETGSEAQEGLSLYQHFLEIGQRMTAIEDRRDALLWTRSLGAPTAPSQVSKR